MPNPNDRLFLDWTHVQKGLLEMTLDPDRITERGRAAIERNRKSTNVVGFCTETAVMRDPNGPDSERYKAFYWTPLPEGECSSHRLYRGLAENVRVRWFLNKGRPEGQPTFLFPHTNPYNRGIVSCHP